MSVVTLTEEFTTINCGLEGCYMQFAVPTSVYNKFRKTGQTWYCPNGHRRCYSVSVDPEKERLARELASAKRTLEYVEADRDRARRDRDHHMRSAAIIKGTHRKLKERIAAGICPCCRRPFANLMRHMQHQHPKYRPRDGKDD